MKKIFCFAAVAVAAFSLTACENFLDSTNYTSKTTSDFPASADDAAQIVTGIYNNLNVSIGNNVHLNHFLWSNAASDDMLGGGGKNDIAMQAEDLMLNYGADMYNGFYTDRYKGVARANVALETLDNCGLSDATRRQYKGEAWFLRAWFYYELASQFGNIPCPTSSAADPTLPQISGAELWSQILSDLKCACDTMPAVNNRANGHVDKYCAQALLGRAYLFASGFFGVSEFPSTYTEGEVINKAYVAQQISDCVTNSGYDLCPEFQDNWAYTNRCSIKDAKMPSVLIPKGADAYNWYEGDGGVNPEAMFVIKFNTQPSWSTTIGYSNQTALFVGVRGQSLDNGECFPFGTGWGMCPVSPQMVEDWQIAEPNDPRRDASIISTSAWSSYKFGGDANIQETGYYQTKIMPVLAWNEDAGKYMKSFSNVMYPNLVWSEGNEDNFQLNSINDMIMIRFAEVLLMDAELNNNAASYTKIRTRAGLPDNGLTEEHLRNERRWELAFEGVRFNDIRRYGEAYAVSALDKQEGVECYNDGTKGDNHASRFNGGYGARYSATKGFAPLPSAQISLSAGSGEEFKFKQNDGWGTSDVDFAGWN